LVFFFENYADALILEKRDELYPHFVENVNSLMFKSTLVFTSYVVFVGFHVYCVLLIDFCLNPVKFLYYIKMFEKEINQKEPLYNNMNSSSILNSIYEFLPFFFQSNKNSSEFLNLAKSLRFINPVTAKTGQFVANNSIRLIFIYF